MTPFYSPRRLIYYLFSIKWGGLAARAHGLLGISLLIHPTSYPADPHLEETQGLLPTMTFATGTNNTVKGNGIESHAIGLQLIKETF